MAHVDTVRSLASSSTMSPHPVLQALSTDRELPSSVRRQHYPSSSSSTSAAGRVRRSITPQSPSHINDVDHGPRDSMQTTGGSSAGASAQFFVRARHDYTEANPSALNFAAGDLIEVLTMLESGWWDGMLVDGDLESEGGDGQVRRGWFPSTYVEAVTVDAEGNIVEVDGDEEGESSYTGGDRINGASQREERDEDEHGFEDSWGSAGVGGLGELAEEMMASRGNDDEDVIDDHEQDTQRRRDRNHEGGGKDERQIDEFGVRGATPQRKRETTDDTVRGMGGLHERHPEEMLDAWVPNLTPDGQVHYFNTQTKESSWELPIATPDLDDEEAFYSQPGTSYLTPSDPSHSNHGDEETGLPKVAGGEVPYPWVARLSDDGREWTYHNRVTGQNQRLPPMGPADDIGVVNMGVKKLSIGSLHPLRASVEIQRKAVDEWEQATRTALQAVLQRAERPKLAELIDQVNDALREIFEAAVAGSAAEEEMSRAGDLGSETGMAQAAMREESAQEMLGNAHISTLDAIRRLLSAFGYVGPLEHMDDLPRPAWTGDMTLIGSIGLMSANVHAATTSRRLAEHSSSVWGEVMRSASKVKDAINNFPALAGLTDTAEGKAAVGSLGIGSLKLLGGRWGFSRLDAELRVLEQGVVLEAQRAKADLDAATRTGDPLNIIRIANRFKATLAAIDIASVVDIDGEIVRGANTQARDEDLRVYAELVTSARQALYELDNGYLALSPCCARLVSNLDCEPMMNIANAAFRALSTLLIITREQRAIVEQGLIRGSIGLRAPPASRSKGFGRPQSAVSQASGASGKSRISRASRISELEEMRRKAKSMEQEFEEDDYEHGRFNELKPIASSSRTHASSRTPNHNHSQGGNGTMSASASQTSLKRGGEDISATSSTTSLAYQQNEVTSDSGSQRGNRSSFMRFMRGRSGSEADDSRKVNKQSKKLAKLLGEDSFASINLPTVPPPASAATIEKAWYLGEDYDPDDIVFDEKGNVKAGTLKALVARLTPHGSTDTSFFQAFLLTFRSFTNGDELFDLLLERYNIAPPEGLDEVELADWKKQKQTPIRLRVVNTIRSWLDVHYLEAQDAHILNRVERFVESVAAEGSQITAKQLTNLVARRRANEGDVPRRVVSGGMLSPPAPILPRVPLGRNLRLTDISPIELSRQLTILESQYFQRIKAVECLNKSWGGDKDWSEAPNVRVAILTANRMAGWVAMQVLSSKDAKTRAAIYKFFLQTAIECRSLNNFSSMAGITAGLNSAPVARLKRTKDLLSAKALAMKADLDQTMDSSKNFSKYKDMLKTINPPCVPFFGFYLSMLTFIEDGNRDTINAPTPVPANAKTNATPDSKPEDPAPPPRKLINFFKRSLAAELLRDVQQYQSQPYNLARCKPVFDYVLQGLEMVEKSGDLYEMSLVLEPREREEERITRMLHDSGFI